MNLVCIGSGNVATHLSLAFKAMGVNILQVWSRDLKNAGILAALTNAEAIDRYDQLDRSADVYLIAVKDDAISAIAAELQGLKGIVLHTSGTTGIEILEGCGSGFGVLYPLQTFSKSKSIAISAVPFCIEGNNKDTAERIEALAHLLSTKVYAVDSAQRKILHLSAVFACNFSNHLFAIGQELLEKNGLPFEMLRPLILETAMKIQTALPVEVQTGPAARHDEQTMATQLSLLEASPELKVIYEMLSERIKNAHP